MTAPKTIPKPEGITAQHHAGWAYLTVPHKRGFSQEVEYQQPGSDWDAASQSGSDWLVPMQQHLTTLFRTRYLRPGQSGEWATGRVWMPNGFELDDGGEKPEPPTNLRASGIGGNVIRVDWAKPATEPDSWRVTWRREGQKHWSQKVVNRGEVELIGDRRAYTIRELARYTPYEITVRAILAGVESDPAELSVVTTAREDEGFGPADPYNGIADTVTADSASVSWDQDDPRAVEKWLIGIPGHGPLIEVTDQEYTFTGLTPATGYIAHVYAVGFDASYAAGQATISFTTKDEGTPGGKRPEWIRKTRESSRTRLAVEWEHRGDETQWAVRLDGNPFEYVLPDDGPTYSWPGLVPGSEHSVEVRCQVNRTWLPRETTKKEFFVVDDKPKPPKPAPPTGLHVHCITDVSAEAEWDYSAEPDAWEIWLNDDREEGAEVTVTPLVNLKDLLPDTAYTVNVVAVIGHPDTAEYAESDPVSFTFTTLATILPPEPPPPPEIGADLPAPKGLMVRAASATTLDAWWTDERPSDRGENFYVACVDGIHWERIEGAQFRFTDLQPGAHTVHVYGVFSKKLTGIARKAATMKEVPA